MLTRKQHELLLLIHERLQAEGVPPSFEEMKEALSLKSKSGIHRLITALEERGFIRRLPNRARALEVIRLPEGYESGATRGGFRPDVIEGGLGKTPPAAGAGTAKPADNVMPFAPPGAPRGGLASRYRSDGDAAAKKTGKESGAAAPPSAGEGFEVPVMGRIAAGVPIAAIQEMTHSIAVPPAMIGMGAHFALDVQGDSMIEAGILDGDTVIVQKTDSAEKGDIVVALVDDEEATLKRFRREGASIALEAANPAYETRILSSERVKVQGRLAGLIRRY